MKVFVVVMGLIYLERACAIVGFYIFFMILGLLVMRKQLIRIMLAENSIGLRLYRVGIQRE